MNIADVINSLNGYNIAVTVNNLIDTVAGLVHHLIDIAQNALSS